MMKLRLRPVLGGAALAMALGLLAAGPAAAAPGTYLMVGYGTGAACEAGKLCLYKDSNYNGRILHAVLVTKHNVTSLANWEFDNKTSSYYNNSGRVVTLYKDASHHGAERTLDPGDRAAVLPAGWDNTITSVKFH